MDEIRSNDPEGASARAQNAGAGARSGGAGPERRFSARRKLAAVTRLLRGEPLETLARELNLTAARLSEWRDRARAPMDETRAWTCLGMNVAQPGLGTALAGRFVEGALQAALSVAGALVCLRYRSAS